jgi:lipopolysaccharide export LptBFGC system permease protein LptF
VLRLVAQGVSLALPIGFLIGLIYGFRAQVVSLRPRGAVMMVAILCSIGSFVAVEWVEPQTLGELRNRIDENRQLGLDVSATVLFFQARFALATAPIVMTAWALLLHARLAGRSRWLMGVVAVASCVAYYSLMLSGGFAVLRSILPPFAGGWLPHIVFGAAIILLSRPTSNDRAPARTTNGMAAL